MHADEQKKLKHTLDALKVHAELQGAALTYLVFPTLNGEFLVSLMYYPDAHDPRSYLKVEVEGVERNVIIDSLKARMELARDRFSVLLGPPPGAAPDLDWKAWGQRVAEKAIARARLYPNNSVSVISMFALHEAGPPPVKREPA